MKRQTESPSNLFHFDLFPWFSANVKYEDLPFGKAPEIPKGTVSTKHPWQSILRTRRDPKHQGDIYQMGHSHILYMPFIIVGG